MSRHTKACIALVVFTVAWLLVLCWAVAHGYLDRGWEG